MGFNASTFFVDASFDIFFSGSFLTEKQNTH